MLYGTVCACVHHIGGRVEKMDRSKPVGATYGGTGQASSYILFKKNWTNRALPSPFPWFRGLYIVNIKQTSFFLIKNTQGRLVS